MKRTLMLVLPLALTSALAFAAPDSEAGEHKGPPPAGFGPPLFVPPHHAEPVYAVTQQTDNPAEAVKTIASQVPQIGSGHYTVKVEIIPQPPKMSDADEHSSAQDKK